MSQCRICGSENANFDVNRHQIICKECVKTTPHKMTRSEFDVKYWGEGNVITVPASTRKEFYEDYISSTCCFDDYKKQTTIASY